MDLLSERLVYRRITLADQQDYMQWYMNDEAMRYITGKALTEEEALARFTKALAVNAKHPELGFYAVKIRNSDTFMGIAKLAYLKDQHAEVGYGSLPSFWGKKYASEMLETLIHHAQMVPQIKILLGIVNEHNTGSKKVLLNSGFILWDKRPEENTFVEYYRLKL